MTTIQASKAEPGSTYLTARGGRVTVVGLTDDGRVRIRNGSGAHTDVPLDFPLVDPDGEVSVEDQVEELALLTRQALKARVAAGLSVEVLDGLYNVRPEDFVVAAAKAAGVQVDASDADPACPDCGKPTPTGQVTGKSGPVFRGHMNPEGSAYCTGSGKLVPQAVGSVDEAARTLRETGRPVELSIPAPANTDTDTDTPAPEAQETPVTDSKKTPAPSEEPGLVFPHLPVHPADPAHYSTLQEPAGLSSLDKVGRALSTLMTQGKVARVGRGLYVRPAEGSTCPWDAKTNPDTEAQIELVKAIGDFHELVRFETWPTIVRVSREIERHRTALEKLRVAYEEDLAANHLGGPKLRKVFAGKRIQERPGCVAFEEALRRGRVDVKTGFPLVGDDVSPPGSVRDDDQAFEAPPAATLDKIEGLLRKALRGSDRALTVLESGSALILPGEGRQVPVSEVLERLDELPAAEAEAYLAHLERAADASRERGDRDEEVDILHELESDALATENDGDTVVDDLITFSGTEPDAGEEAPLSDSAREILEAEPVEDGYPEETPRTQVDPEAWDRHVLGSDLVRRADVLEIIQRHREEGETDLRSVRDHVQDLKPSPLPARYAGAKYGQQENARTRDLAEERLSALQDLVVLVQATLSLDEDDLDPESWKQALDYVHACEVMVEDFGKECAATPAGVASHATVRTAFARWKARSAALQELDLALRPVGFETSEPDAIVEALRGWNGVRTYLDLAESAGADLVVDTVQGLNDAFPEGPVEVFLVPGELATVRAGVGAKAASVKADVQLPPGFELVQRHSPDDLEAQGLVPMKAVREAAASRSLLQIMREAKADGITVRVELSVGDPRK